MSSRSERGGRLDYVGESSLSLPSHLSSLAVGASRGCVSLDLELSMTTDWLPPGFSFPSKQSSRLASSAQTEVCPRSGVGNGAVS